MSEVTRFNVYQDLGYGRCYSRTYPTREAAESGMAEWQREGISPDTHPSIINGGEWSIEPAIYVQRDNGALFFDRLVA